MRFTELVAACRESVTETLPWDLVARQAETKESVMLLDVREPAEFDAMRITNSINVPRGILEAAADYGYEETLPELAQARARPIVTLCRSGNRSLLAARTLQHMGFNNVVSLQTGLRGWSEYEQPLVDAAGREVSFDDADAYFAPVVSAEQLGPAA